MVTWRYFESGLINEYTPKYLREPALKRVPSDDCADAPPLLNPVVKRPLPSVAGETAFVSS